VWLWIAFFVLVLVLLALDLLVFHRDPRATSLTTAVAWSSFWVGLGLAFSGVIYLAYHNGWIESTQAPGDAVIDYLTAYLMEESLSIDNLFVMALIFGSFRIRREHQHKILFWGILGAIVARTIMLAGGVWLVSRFTWVFYVFGGILVFSGAKLLMSRKHDDTAPRESRFARLAGKVLPLTQKEHGGKLTAKENGRRVFTNAFLALVTIEVSDVVFAVDSVPAVLGITSESFVVVTSNIFAVLGLRSMFFVLAGMMHKFRYLQIALALLLVAIGAKLLLHTTIHIPNWISLVAVVGIISAGIVISLIADKRAQPS